MFLDTLAVSSFIFGQVVGAEVCLYSSGVLSFIVRKNMSVSWFSRWILTEFYLLDFMDCACIQYPLTEEALVQDLRKWAVDPLPDDVQGHNGKCWELYEATHYFLSLSSSFGWILVIMNGFGDASFITCKNKQQSTWSKQSLCVLGGCQFTGRAPVPWAECKLVGGALTTQWDFDSMSRPFWHADKLGCTKTQNSPPRCLHTFRSNS